MSSPEEPAMTEPSASDPSAPGRASRPPFDPTAFVLGTLFVVIAVVGLLDPSLARRIDLGVLVPATLVTIGGALLVGSAIGRRSDR